MNSWERFDEKLLPKKRNFYIDLNMEDITDVNYRHAKRVFNFFSNKNVDKYHDSKYMFKVMQYYFQMFLRILEINVLKYMNLVLLISHQQLD